MKKTILTNIFFLFTTSIFGQNFILSELIKINDYQIDDFDTYVSQKGYKFYENENSDFADVTSYVFYVKGMRKSYISKFFYKTQAKEMVSFQTNNTTTYLKIKSDLKTLGFKFISTKTNTGTTFFYYKRGILEVSLASFVQENSYGIKLTNYEISVSKL